MRTIQLSDDQIVVIRHALANAAFFGTTFRNTDECDPIAICDMFASVLRDDDQTLIHDFTA